jgi:hypothetical protein
MVIVMNIKSHWASQSRTKSNPVAIFLFLAPILALGPACAYRLTNLHTVRPENIKSIFVEGVYDTSAEPVPHEKLWDELQRAIAANGQLRLAKPEAADAILRAHVIKSFTAKAGERKVNLSKSKKKDPEIFAAQSSPPTPGVLRDISVADDYYLKSSWSSLVIVEIYDLRTKKLILQRQYPMSAEVAAVRGDQPTEIHHLRHEESFQASYGNAARSLAERVVTDLLVR